MIAWEKILVLLMIFLLAACRSSGDEIVSERAKSKVKSMSYKNIEDNPSLLTKSEYDPEGVVTEKSFRYIVGQITDFAKKNNTIGREIRGLYDWDDDTFNAKAAVPNDHYVAMLFFGGLVRKSGMSNDAFVLVACHEAGHLLAGYPHIRGVAVEGTSDYYSVRCAKLLWEYDDNSAFTDDPSGRCDEFYAGSDLPLCNRVMTAVNSLRNSMYPLSGMLRRSDKVAGKTISRHPPHQCRVDTLIAGTLCAKRLKTSTKPLTIDDFEAVSCNELSGDSKHTIMPRCWYNPDFPPISFLRGVEY